MGAGSSGSGEENIFVFLYIKGFRYAVIKSSRKIHEWIPSLLFTYILSYCFLRLQGMRSPRSLFPCGSALPRDVQKCFRLLEKQSKTNQEFIQSKKKA